jgi:hypothetical protein
MLAAMTSTTLTHATAPAAGGLFYATCATIIPVLLLAIAVQGRTIDDLTSSWLKIIRTPAAKVTGREKAAFGFITIAAVVVIVIVAWGVTGELDAISSLYQNPPADPGGVLDAVVVLTAGAAAIPLVTFARALIGGNEALIREVRSTPPKPPAAAQQAQDGSPAEDDSSAPAPEPATDTTPDTPPA